MNPKGDDAWRRSLLAKKIFTSLTLLQILSNSGLAFACFFQKLPERDFFFGRVSSLSWSQRKKPDSRTKKRLPEGSLSQGFCV